MRRFSRRELLGLGAAAGMVAASGAGAGVPTAPTGLLRLGIGGGALGGFAPGEAGTPILSVAGQGAVFDCLTEVAADGVLTGELAVGWAAGPDARRWRVRLRDGVRFHDGTPFGAADVVETFRALMAAGAVPELQQVRETGPLAVEFRLRAGDPGFPLALSDPRYVILPAGRYAEAAAGGIGTGLYATEAAQTPGRLLLRRVAQHWRDGQAGWFERVEILAITDPEARRAALDAGRVDAINGVRPEWTAEWRRARRVRVTAVTSTDGREGTAHPGGDLLIAHNVRLVNSGRISGRSALDSGRIAERWWFST